VDFAPVTPHGGKPIRSATGTVEANSE